MRNFSILLATFGVGLVLGQQTILKAFDIDRIEKEAYEVAALSYEYGCLKHSVKNNNNCKPESIEFKKTISTFKHGVN